MASITISAAVSARDKARFDYSAAVEAFHAAYIRLAAWDRIVSSRGVDSASFGEPLDVIALRHPIAAPGVQGVHHDIGEMIASTQIEG